MLMILDKANPDERTTSLTIDHVPVYRVGEILELLKSEGFSVEINVGEKYLVPSMPSVAHMAKPNIFENDSFVAPT